MPSQSLRGGLDRDVYQIVRKLEDEGAASKPSRLTVVSVYDSIKRSNSSLARQKKRPLEDAIDRVLAVRKQEIKAASEGADDDSDEALSTATQGQKPESSFSINRQLTKHWKMSPATPGTGIERSATQVDTTQPSEMEVDSAPPADRQANGEPRAKRKRPDKDRPSKASVDRSPPTGFTIANMAGIDETLSQLRKPVFLPLRFPEVFQQLHFKVSPTVLLHGPSGCGKTTLANAVAATIGVPFISVSGSTLTSGISGESEKKIRDIFDEAISLAPCILFIDEIDCIAGKTDVAQKAMETRMVAEINTGMDRIKRNTPLEKTVVILAATSKPDTMDLNVRRRFGTEAEMGMPNEHAREQIFRAMTHDLTVAQDVDFKALALLTPGYVGADLDNVVVTAVYNAVDDHASKSIEQRNGDGISQVGLSAVNKSLMDLCAPTPAGDENIPSQPIQVSFAAFKRAIESIEPAAKREGFSTVPDTSWSKVGAMRGVRQQLEESIIGPITDPERYARVGIRPAAGILLWGPPGCGKTLVAKAVANESKANFISIKGPEVLSKWVGESERAVRKLFARARASAPCVVFFDEMDAIVPVRGDASVDASTRVVNALLTELDGVDGRRGVFVIGATNRPDIIDPAIRRPGRLGTSVYVGLPTPDERVDILRTLYRNEIPAQYQSPLPQLMADLTKVAKDPRCHHFSGADLGHLLQAAGKACLRRDGSGVSGGFKGLGVSGASAQSPVITMDDWETALSTVKPSVKDLRKYQRLLEAGEQA